MLSHGTILIVFAVLQQQVTDMTTGAIKDSGGLAKPYLPAYCDARAFWREVRARPLVGVYLGLPAARYLSGPQRASSSISPTGPRQFFDLFLQRCQASGVRQDLVNWSTNSVPARSDAGLSHSRARRIDMGRTFGGR
jgi:hypothetical protein